MGILLDYSTLSYLIVFLITSRLGAQQLYFCDTPNKDPCVVANENTPYEPEARFENCQHNNSNGFCDRYIRPGWYRFYDRMLDRCPALLSCGTLYPSWLNGSHPVEVNTEVVRTVCTVGFAGCCNRQVKIKIRNCGQFMAYCLPALDTCPERYCFGTTGPCDALTTSSSQTEAGSTTVDPAGSTVPSITTSSFPITPSSTSSIEPPNHAEVSTEGSQTTTQTTLFKSTTVVSSNSEKDGDSTGSSAISISIGIATAALCISCFLVVFVLCYHRRKTSNKENATVTDNPYEDPISADPPVVNVYELPGKLQTESGVYDELPSEEEYQNEAKRDNPYDVISEKAIRKK